MTKLTYDQLIPGKRYLATVEVKKLRSGDMIKITMWTGADATYEEIPEPPKPLAVGDRVRWGNPITCTGVIKDISEGDAWVRYDRGGHSTYPLSDLTRIEGEG